MLTISAEGGEEPWRALGAFAVLEDLSNRWNTEHLLFTAATRFVSLHDESFLPPTIHSPYLVGPRPEL
jgi:hypothetical protein